MGCVGVGGNWAGDGRGGGFPDTKSWDFCSYFKKTVPFLSFPFLFLWKKSSITHQEYEPKNTELSEKPPITHMAFD